jgi:hypothetical protein
LLPLDTSQGKVIDLGSKGINAKAAENVFLMPHLSSAIGKRSEL